MLIYNRQPFFVYIFSNGCANKQDQPNPNLKYDHNPISSTKPIPNPKPDLKRLCKKTWKTTKKHHCESAEVCRNCLNQFILFWTSIGLKTFKHYTTKYLYCGMVIGIFHVFGKQKT